MKIWLIKEGEPLPIDHNPRLMRTGLLAEYLDAKEIDVVWFTSSFSHGEKKRRFNKSKTVSIFNSSKLVLLNPKTVYKKNTSFKRLVYSYQLGKDFLSVASNMEKPDIIICSYPLISLAKGAVKYGEKNNVPVILDIRDLWPDIFERIFPKYLKFLSNIILLPFDFNAKKILKQATSITSIVPSHLQWALLKAGRAEQAFDKVIHLGYKDFNKEENISNTSEFDYWPQYGVNSLTWNICFFGTMSRMTTDLDTVIEAFINISKKYTNMRLILCGKGDALEKYRIKSSNNPHIIFPGWVNKNQILDLMKISKVALYPYHNLIDFRDSLTNKMIEYMYGGLPIISSLEGYSKDYIIKNNIGLIYKEESQDSFANELMKLYNDEELRKNLCNNSKNSYYKDFEIEMINKQFLDLVMKILNCDKNLSR